MSKPTIRMKGIPKEKQTTLIKIASVGRGIVSDTVNRQGRKVIFKEENETAEKGRETETSETDCETE